MGADLLGQALAVVGELRSCPCGEEAAVFGATNMIWRAYPELGVAIHVAIFGSPTSPVERLHAFQRAWWVMAAIVALALVPNFSYPVKGCTSNLVNSPQS